MQSAAYNFIALMKHPVKFRIFLLLKLPVAFFSGVRIENMDEDSCAVRIPYKWFTQNPFHSTYFACLAMAAEMSTGALAMAHIYKRIPGISMLVIKLEATYFKKAIGKTVFVCAQGQEFKNAIQKAVDSGEPQTVSAKSTGRNKQGEIVAEFFVTWSFKAKGN